MLRGYTPTKKLQNIDISNILVKNKKDEPLLQIADLIAHALYKCVDKSDRNFQITEPRYLRELAQYFFGHPGNQAVVGAGLYCVHSPKDLQLDSDVAEVFDGLVTAPPWLRHIA